MQRASSLPTVLGLTLALVLIGLGSAALLWTAPLEEQTSQAAIPTPAPSTPVPTPSTPASTPSAPPAIPGTPTQLALGQRQALYKQLAQAEDQTVQAASSRFPGGGADYQKFVDAATLEYQTRIAQANGLTLENVNALSLEGLTQGWATQ